MGFSPKLERIVAQEDREMKSHREETKIINLGVAEERKEVKVGLFVSLVHDGISGA